MNWEAIDDFHSRAKVKGGWLVKAWEEDSSGTRMAMCFVPDPMHGWTL